jgi:hypothetical protein
VGAVVTGVKMTDGSAVLIRNIDSGVWVVDFGEMIKTTVLCDSQFWDTN